MAAFQIKIKLGLLQNRMNDFPWHKNQIIFTSKGGQNYSKIRNLTVTSEQKTNAKNVEFVSKWATLDTERVKLNFDHAKVQI